MESWCYSLASTFFAEWAAAHQNNSYCCPFCCCAWPLQRNTQEFTILEVWFLHLIKSVQNNTRLKISPRYRNCFFSCLVSKRSKISHDQHFCSTSYEISQYKKFNLLLVAWSCKNNSQSPWHNFLLATTLSQIFYIVRESSFTPYLAFGLAAIYLTSKIPHFLFPEVPPKLSMKEGSLFCSYEIQRHGMLLIMFLVFWESSRRGGVHGLWFHDVWTLRCKSSWILNDFFTEN